MSSHYNPLARRKRLLKKAADYRNRRRIKQNCSIQDIIQDDSIQHEDKVNWIRHQYVYYDGNYDLFHDENGNPTELKHLLNDIIDSVIRGTLDPSELSNINKEILKLRKEKNEEAEVKHQKELETYIQTKQKEIESGVDIKPTIIPEVKELAPYKKGIANAEAYFEIIDKYIASLPKEKQEEVKTTWSYRDLKNVAKCWIRNSCPSLMPEELKEQSQQLDATRHLLEGYDKYWKNNSKS